MKKELLRFEYTDAGRAEMPEYLLNFSIYEGKITGITTATSRMNRLLLAVLSGRYVLAGHAIYLRGKKQYDCGEWLEKNCFVLDPQTQFVDELSVWENLFINANAFRSFGDGCLAELQMVLEKFGLDRALAKKAIGDLTYEEKGMLLLIKAYLLKKRLVLINLGRIRFSKQGLLHFYTLMRRMESSGMTFVMLNFEVGRMKNYVDYSIYIENGIVQMVSEPEKFDSYSPLEPEKWDMSSQKPSKGKLVYSTEVNGNPLELRAGEIVTLLTDREISPEVFLALLNLPQHLVLKISRQAPHICYARDFTPSNNLFTNMRVWENLCIMKSMSGVPPREKRHVRESVCRYCVEAFGHDVGRLSISTLSQMDDGSTLTGMIYLMAYKRNAPPEASYYRGIRDAYEELGLDSEIKTVLAPARRRSIRASTKAAQAEE